MNGYFGVSRSAASRSIFTVYVFNWECSVGAARNERPLRPLQPQNNWFGIPKPRILRTESPMVAILCPLAFPYLYNPRNCWSFVKITVTLRKKKIRKTKMERTYSWNR